MYKHKGSKEEAMWAVLLGFTACKKLSILTSLGLCSFLRNKTFTTSTLISKGAVESEKFGD